MKKIQTLLLLGMLCFLTACAQNTAQNPSASPSQPAPSSSGLSENAGAQNGKKPLIAYFTHEGNSDFQGDLSDVDAITSATVQRKGNEFPPQVIDGVHKGNTQIIAENIAQHTGGDLFAIQVVNKYPVDAFDTLDVAQKERADNARPKLSTHVKNISDYDVIYLGFPDWWGTMPMPVFTFLEEYDFAGKTIIPFATHDGSGLGSSRRDIESECPDATVLDGLAIRYSDVKDAESKVDSWIDGLDIGK